MSSLYKKHKLDRRTRHQVSMAMDTAESKLEEAKLVVEFWEETIRGLNTILNDEEYSQAQLNTYMYPTMRD